MSKRYTDDTSNDGCCILWLCVTMRSNELLSIDSDHELSERTTSNWTGHTSRIVILLVWPVLVHAVSQGESPCDTACTQHVQHEYIIPGVGDDVLMLSN